MNGVLLVLIIVVIAAIGLAVYSSSKASGKRSAASLADAKADARRLIERLGGQVLNLTGTDDASKQAMADASERYTAASSQIDQATTARQAALAKESAIEGLYYVRAARTAMGMDPGPELESLSGQRSAGTVTEDRRINYEGREIEASPTPSGRTPNYYPGGRVAGRPVPAGWYSEPWWKPALVAGAWGLGSVLLFDAMFSGMHGVDYGSQGFAAWTAEVPTLAASMATAVTAAAGMAEVGTAAAISAAATLAASSIRWPHTSSPKSRYSTRRAFSSTANWRGRPSSSTVGVTSSGPRFPKQPKEIRNDGSSSSSFPTWTLCTGGTRRRTTPRRWPSGTGR
jgi:hypothetical protein